jgi:crotonobetainyl-CoA:carnitine CoA-transferase CaiB-like acyl-CoA transferase
VSVLGVCLGLFHRERTGAGQRMWTSLLGCSAMMQSGELVRFQGRAPAVRGGRDFGGPSAWDRFYRVKDGWLRVQAPDVSALCSAGLLSYNESDVQRGVAERLARMCADDALAALASAGIPAVRARLPGELPEDADLRGLNMFVTMQMEDGSPFYSTGRYACFSRTQQTSVFTPPGVGEHSREVLAEAGLQDAEIQALLDAGCVRQGQRFQIAGIQNYR